jgi:hypothetical protein
MKTLIATCAMTFAFAGTAWAQEEGEEETTDDGGMGGEMSGESTMTTDEGGGGGGTEGGGMAEGTGGGAHSKGLQVSYNAAGDSPVLHYLHGMGTATLDLEVLFGFTNISPDGGDSTSVVEIGIGGAYRMYKDMDGRIHPYLAPGAFFALSTDEAAGEPKIFGVGAEMGVDFMVFDQFSLGAALGAGLQFEITEAANTLSIGTYTTSINATYWWGA